MKTFQVSRTVILSFALVLSGLAQASTWDLTNDWQPNNNPNGVWSYRAGNVDLPWIPSSGAYEPSTTPGNFLPIFLKGDGINIPANVYIHPWDGANGGSNGMANALWTAPVATTVNLSGASWWSSLSVIGRSSEWLLLVNGGVISDGYIIAGDGHTAAAPYLFSQGSGGSAALSGIHVDAGDTIELEILATSQYGTFYGVNLNIQAVPEPSTFLILLPATLLPLLRRRRAIGDPEGN